jgi:hypothetical protein
LPCVHFRISRADRLPRLTILDIHVRWQCQDLRKDAAVSHLRVDLHTQQHPKKSSPSQWNFAELVVRFEPYFSVAERSSKYQAILNDTLQRLNNVRSTEGRLEESPAPDDPTRLLDPQYPMLPGRPDSHPSQRSILSRQMGSGNRKHGSSLAGQPKRKKVYQCSICKQMGHNAQTCMSKLN